ncbi:hypothetical protein IKM56_02895 [Candidatus Saccharibacteria bacterium]|nr:hypothetical protein [Candidatus Saccharibacteria bacterium]
MQPKISLFNKKRFKSLNSRGLSVGFLYDINEPGGHRKYCIDSSKIDMELGNSEALYGVTELLKPITVFPGYDIMYEFDCLTSITIETSNYVIGNRSCEETIIQHATLNTKYNEIIYRNPTLNKMLLGEKTEEITAETFCFGNIVCNVKFESYVLVSFSQKDETEYYMRIKLSKGVSIKKAREIIKRIDAAISLLLPENSFSNYAGLISASGVEYTYYFDSYKCKENFRYLDCLFDKSKRSLQLLESMKITFSFGNENAIAPLLFPSHDYDFAELKFIRYYTALEEIRKKEEYEPSQNSNKDFIELLIENNQDLANRIMGKQNAHNTDIEMRALRNQYLHNGFAINNDKLEVKDKRNETKYLKAYSRAWIINASVLLKVLYHKYLLDKAGIVDSEDIAKRITKRF